MPPFQRLLRPSAAPACAARAHVTAIHRLEVSMLFPIVLRRGAPVLAAASLVAATALARAAESVPADPADPHAAVPEAPAATGLAGYQRYQPAVPAAWRQADAPAALQGAAPAMTHHNHHPDGATPTAAQALADPSGHAQTNGPMKHAGHASPDSHMDHAASARHAAHAGHMADMADMPGMQH
ncbi:hypothetical protein [Ralstonia solanacearum]|nr:hypothetical protein [Ralstonia solanacearum]